MLIRNKVAIVVPVLLLLLTPVALTADKNDFIHTSPDLKTEQFEKSVKTPRRLISKSTLTGQKLGIAIEWDFETGWQGWTHTNGLAFPSGWDVQPSSYKLSYTPPNAGDSTFWIDSDSADDLGVHWVADTVLSPKIVADPTTNWLQYGVGLNNTGADFLEVGLKYYNGMSWSTAPLITYYTDTVCVDLIDISAYNTHDSIQIYFYYDDTSIWTYYAAFDNIIIYDTIDVGTISIENPGNYTKPNMVIKPEARFGNFGDASQVFEAHYKMDTAGINIYSEMALIELAAGADTIYSFPDHTTLEEGTNYDITAYTVLRVGTDAIPGNDTINSSTLLSNKYWEILPSLPGNSSGHSLVSIGDGFVYLLCLGNSDTVLKYDIANETWSADTVNPYGSARYGYAKAVNNKIYRIGGIDLSSNTLSRVDIYDPVARTWDSAASSPYGLVDQTMGVYKDSLIYTFGGGNWWTNPIDSVYIYDTYNDSWVSATNLPDARGTTGGGIIDSFAIVACGYKLDGSFGNDYTVGIINSSDPTIINWSPYAVIPGIDTAKYRVPSAIDSYNKEFYIVGGQDNAVGSNQTLSFNPYTYTWVEEMPKNVAFANVQPLAVAADIRTPLEEISIYAAGGYNNGYLLDVEQYHTADTLISGISDDNDVSIEFGFISVSQLATPGYASITYLTSKSSFTTLKVYDLIGRNVRTLVDRVREAPGKRTAYWDYNNNNGSPVANGVYFLRLESDGKIAKEKMILIK